MTKRRLSPGLLAALCRIILVSLEAPRQQSLDRLLRKSVANA
jgi:hypothetical protein